MDQDVIESLGHSFLGSRLKRLADRLQAEAGEILRAHHLPVQPAQQLVLAALHRKGPLTVGGIAQHLKVSQPTITRSVDGLQALGLIAAQKSTDQRRKVLSLTAKGKALIGRAEKDVWPLVGVAARDLCCELPNDFLESLAMLEAALDRRSLTARVAAAKSGGVRIVEFRDALADTFFRLNVAWIAEMFAVEQTDIDVLSQPRARIIDRGGVILFAETDDLGVVGTCALMPDKDGWWELTKMSVAKAARGRGIGEFLLRETLARAKAMRIDKLFLLTNKTCAPAIHLYEKHGFEHDAEIMAMFGAHYARCNVAMRYAG